LGLDQHPHAIAHFVDVAEFCVEVTEADEAARNALCFLAGDQELPSVEAERAFLAYGRDGRDVRVCVEIKIFTASSSTPSTRRLLDGVAVPVPHHSTGPAQPRHRREMTY
jgi:hypothetical protein